MRILHTADWHFGKTLEGRDRLPEQRAFVDELCQLCTDEKIDMVVMAGDVYQTVNPSAEAEDLLYDCLNRLAMDGRRAVALIAGNHDNPERLMAPRGLCDRLGITIAGLPGSPIQPFHPARGSLVSRPQSGASWAEVYVPGCDQSAVVGMLPYPSEARLQALLSQVLDDEAELRASYQMRVRQTFERLAKHYRPDTVNLCVSHLYVQGGLESESEIQIQVGGAYAVNSSVFPEEADYVALGHLHRPQWVGDAKRVRYAGSPIAYSFSEAGYQKTVTLVDVSPGGTPIVREIPVGSGRPLVKWQAKEGLAQVYQWLESLHGEQAWIDLEIHLNEHLAVSEIQRIRELHTGIVHIRPVFPEDQSSSSVSAQTASLGIEEQFVRFYQSRHNHPPDGRTVELFMELSASLQEEGRDEE